ncbi:MAG: acyl-CoA/acyl-ACP dehydrogenase [Deltaproteobacteria bacterium]|nr:acyl-CoA/acyl-ACP dehydrogenase [Deltaproteobacteria bacterium]
MEFNLNEETVLLKNSAERYLREKCPSSLARELIEDRVGFSKSIWKETAELGWLGLIYDQKYGGFEGAFFDLFILFEEMGKVLLPSPFLCSAVLSGLVINEAGDDSLKNEYLPSIIQGEKILTTALLDEQGGYDAQTPGVEARKTQTGSYVLNGTKLLVPYAHVADEIILCANVKDEKQGGPTLFKIDGNAEGLEKAALDTTGSEKLSALILKDVAASAESIIGSVGQGDVYLSKVMPKATVLKCGEMLGGLQRVVEMTVEYMKERHQFGRPLGTLQAVQHFCADMATYLETARLIAYQAAYLLSEGLPCAKEISMAKAWCGDAYNKTTRIGHQLHGGIGFTEEHDLHLFYTHAMVSALDFGSSWSHRSKVADELGI